MKEFVENYYFRLPKGASGFLAAISTLQSILPRLKQRCSGKIQLVLDVPRRLQFLLAALETTWVPAEEASKNLDDYDLAFDFDMVKAYKLSLKTEKHIVQAFGTLLGAEPASMPNMEVFQVPEEKQSIGILLLTPIDTFKLRQVINDPHVYILYEDGEHEDCSLETLYGLVADAKMIVGFRSGLTYMAAALGRSVLEIYDDSVHDRWLTKLENKRYTVMYIKDIPEDTSPADIVKSYGPSLLQAIGEKWTRLNVQ